MPSLLEIIFCLIFLSYMEIIISHGKESCSSSCGSLQNIKHPFHLKGDPAKCGSSDYELNCEGNNTVLDIKQRKYYVKNISYHDSLITLVDASFSQENCRIPDGSIYIDDIKNPFRFFNYNATFINCSIKMNSPRYDVPCLSKNNSTVYVISEASYVRDVPVNCSVLCSVLMSEKLQPNIFDNLKQGFTLFWFPLINSSLDAIRFCAENSEPLYYPGNVFAAAFGPLDFSRIAFVALWPILWEVDFLDCLYALQYKLIFYAAVVIILVLDIILVVLVLLLIGRFLLSPLCVLSFLAYKLFKLLLHVDSIERFLQNQKAFSPSRYSYNDIITITSNFKEKLGQGGFGSVYKGRLLGGYLVAVKMLGKSMGDGEDFINEVSTIGRIHHVNIVQLVGFCAEGSYRALVYEYMANGSLEKYIFTSNKKNRILNTDKLLEIALSVAKGLHYLHQGCNMRILHFDIKPHNILLDHKFTPKISDFGLAKLHPKEHSLVSISAARGTIGYIAPELISRSFGTISHKSDVYSFGMLLMDIAGGRMHTNMNANNSSQVYYPSWIYDKLQKRELSKNFEIFDIDDFERKLCKVGLCCIQTRPSDRPSMINVVEMLEADVDSIHMPPKPFFSSSNVVSQENILLDESLSELSII